MPARTPHSFVRNAVLVAIPLTLVSFGMVYGGLSLADAREGEVPEVPEVRATPRHEAIRADEPPSFSKVGEVDAKPSTESRAPELAVDEEVSVVTPRPQRERGRAVARAATGTNATPPDAPSARDLAVIATLARRAAATCAHGAAFEGHLYVTFMGETGRVGTVEARGGADAIERCVERESFAFRVAPFTRTSYVAHIPLDAPQPAVTTATALPNLPSTDAVDRAFAGARRRFATCLDGQGGDLQIAATLAGVSGEATMVVVLPPWSGTEQGACVERAVREHVHVAPFESRSHTVTTRITL